MRYAHLALFAAALFAAAPAAARNFQPPREWTASGGADIVRVRTRFDTAVLHPLANGSVLWVGNDAEGGGIALRALLRPGQAPAMDQFGDMAANHRLEAERVLFADDAVALVRMVEAPPGGTGLTRRVLVALDLAGGGVLWAAPLAADGAVRLSGGDTLVLAGGSVMRLSPAAAPRWVRHLDEFAERGERLQAQALLESAGRVLVVLSRQRASTQGEIALAPRVLALEAADGALAWTRDAAGTRACGAALISGALVVATAGPLAADRTATVTVQRFTADSVPLPVASIPNVPADGLACRLLDVDGAAVLATQGNGLDLTLSSIGADGVLRWRRNLASGYSPVIARVPGSDDVVHVATLFAGALGGVERRIERRRGADGAAVWSVTRSAQALLAAHTVAVSPQAAHLAAIVLDPISQRIAGIVREDLSLADGSLLASPDDALARRERLPYDAQFVDGLPFDAAIGADGGIVVRRRSSTSSGDPLWSRAEPGATAPTATPGGISLRAAGPGRLLVVANYLIPDDVAERRAAALLMLDRDTGARIWRQDLNALGSHPVSVLDAGTAGVLLSLTPCQPGDPCGGAQRLRRLSATDGSETWESAIQSSLAAIAGNDVVAFEQGTNRNWRLLAAPLGAGAWAQPLPPWSEAFDLALLPSGEFRAVLSYFAGDVPVVDVERRSLIDGTAASTLRAGLVGDQVYRPTLRPAVNGLPLLTALMQGPEPGQENLLRPLVQLLDVDGVSAQQTLRPTLSGTDRWWTLQPVASSTGSITRQPLRSERFRETSIDVWNSRVALAFLDLASGSLRGEQLVERYFDDALRGYAPVDLVQVLSGGAILAAEARLGGDGLRRRTLMRLAAPADASGDLRLRLLDGDLEATGFGPSRRIRVEVDNLGGTAATDAVFGTAPLRFHDPVHAVFVGCSVVGGSATCPLDPALRRVSLAPGATLRLEWEMYDAGFRNAVPVASGSRAGARIFIDSPWGYADTEPGNNVVEFALRLGAFGDDFE